jgi:hypothetical protein
LRKGSLEIDSWKSSEENDKNEPAVGILGLQKFTAAMKAA